MSIDALFARKSLVFLSALIYWTGVAVHARRLRRRLGKSPNLKPRGIREDLLWAGWIFVTIGWMGQPFVIGGFQTPVFSFLKALSFTAGFPIGILLAAAGQAGTYWCYTSLGDSWRIGVDRGERTVLVKSGPYRFVRHPIYLFQIVMLLGMLCLLPTLFSLIVLFIHFICVEIKTIDEESYLMSVHEAEYRDYLNRTGRLFPKVK